MKIVVLAGGTSSEREISIVSGSGVCRALREKGHEAILLDVFFGCGDEEAAEGFPREYDVDRAEAAMKEKSAGLGEALQSRREFFGPHVLELCGKAEMVFLALHGANGEDGKVQAAFDLFGIRYTGTDYLSSAVAMDKALTKVFFEAYQVPAPRGIHLVRGGENTDPAEAGLEYPVIVKPCCGGSSVGVSIAEKPEEYQKALEEAFLYEDQVVVEEFIRGREFSVAVIDGRAYPVIEIAPREGFYDFKNKYTAGSTVETCPAALSPEKTAEMQEAAVRGAEALGITGYCRLDFIMREDGRFYCLEANTLPGMTPTSLIPQEAAALGIGYPELCEELIRISLKKYQ